MLDNRPPSSPFSQQDVDQDEILTKLRYEPLFDWWDRISLDDVQAAGAKAAEYGSRDLTELGRKLAALMGWEDCPERVMSELGCWFYIAGKVERAFEALGRHELPSDDTAHDICVYGMMIRRIRAVGEWK